MALSIGVVVGRRIQVGSCVLKVPGNKSIPGSVGLLLDLLRLVFGRGP